MQFSVAEFWQQMGPLAKGVVIVLIGMSFLSLTAAVEKWIFLSRTFRESTRFLRVWREQVAIQGYLAAAPLAEKYPHSLVAQIVIVGTHVLDEVTEASQRNAVYDRVVRREILAAGSVVRHGLGLLATIGSTAPFVGLFGTVVGIVNAFRKMAVSGQGGLGVVSAGIAEALVTTALGIGVAIPAVWLFNFLTQRITRLLNEMECVAEELAVGVLRAPYRGSVRPLSPNAPKEKDDGVPAWPR
jgi:biopolymer transport protein ExbB/TolQ